MTLTTQTLPCYNPNSTKLMGGTHMKSQYKNSRFDDSIVDAIQQTMTNNIILDYEEGIDE